MLNEQIKSILDEKRPANFKRTKLLELGLTNTDIRALEMQNHEAFAPTTHRASRTDALTFGVEFETYNASRENIIEEFACRELRCESQSYNHNNTPTFKIVNDGSIHGVEPNETVTPVLGKKSGFATLKKACNALTCAGAKVNKSTGLHVHIGGNITDEQYINTFVNYAYMQKLISSWLAPSRRNQHYAKEIHSYIDRLKTCATRSDVYSALLHDRYWSVNPCANMRHGTIEFRQHQGSTNYAKIEKWVTFCLKLVLYSRNHRLQSTISNVDDIPFLNATEKAYFKARIAHFATHTNE